MILAPEGVRDHGGGAHAEHLRQGEDDEGEIAGDGDGGDGRGAEAAHPVQVDEEVEGLRDHRHEHEARGLQQVARDRAGGEVLHRWEDATKGPSPGAPRPDWRQGRLEDKIQFPLFGVVRCSPEPVL